MNKFIILLSVLLIFGCKPKDEAKTVENKSDVKSKDDKPAYLNWDKRMSLGEGIVRRSLDADASNITFESFYKYIGENDGYVCGKVKWIDTYRQREVDNYYYIYMSFLDGKVSSHSDPMVFDINQEYPMEKYKMFCSLD
ncbi:hypothetical protein JMT66_05465 [Kosakonia cowanii]|uniref:hypothetical protein n=1 Tax=Kosakonia cowanii TaxID=208223 RepID=UPI001E5F3781|nr:hypothetical protein [Kosakonia cowanii]UGS47125.1 hypothetical protein JMT66_05465 [Kosakonia cowanii]